MNLKMSLSIMVGIVGVLLTVLALQGLVAGEWSVIAPAVTSVIVMIGFLGFVIVAIAKR
jgi:hypothetical protein